MNCGYGFDIQASGQADPGTAVAAADGFATALASLPSALARSLWDIETIARGYWEWACCLVIIVA